MRRRILRFCLAAFLLTSAIAKLATGHRDQYLLGPAFFYASTVIELVVACLLAGGFRTRLLASVLQLVAVAGIVIAALRRGPCDCMGALFEHSKAAYLVFTSTMGLFATILAWRPTTPPPASVTAGS